MGELTKAEREFMDWLRQLNPREWLLFVNAGFTMEDARALYDLGLIDTTMQMGMPAARLRGSIPTSEFAAMEAEYGPAARTLVKEGETR